MAAAISRSKRISKPVGCSGFMPEKSHDFRGEIHFFFPLVFIPLMV